MKFQPVHLLPLGLHGGMDIIAECDIGIRMSQNLTQCLNVHSRLYTASRKCVPQCMEIHIPEFTVCQRLLKKILIVSLPVSWARRCVLETGIARTEAPDFGSPLISFVFFS